MHINICTIILILSIHYSNGHTYLSSITINGEKETNCLRPLHTNSPVADITSPDMMCGVLPQGAQPALAKCNVTAGGTVGLQWNHNSPTPDDDIVDKSHVGPCLVYLSSDNGATFFKIYEDGYNNVTKEFCVTRLIANKGYLQVKIPSDIASGDYLMRAELIALHQTGSPQPYVDCSELHITGSGDNKPTGVKLPGAYSLTDPGLSINIYYPPFTSYVIPGPPVYESGSADDDVDGGSNKTVPLPSPKPSTSAPVSSENKAGLTAGEKSAIALILVSLFVLALVLAIRQYRKHGQIFGLSFGYNPRRGETTAEERKHGDYMPYLDSAL